MNEHGKILIWIMCVGWCMYSGLSSNENEFHLEFCRSSDPWLASRTT